MNDLEPPFRIVFFFVISRTTCQWYCIDSTVPFKTLSIKKTWSKYFLFFLLCCHLTWSRRVNVRSPDPLWGVEQIKVRTVHNACTLWCLSRWPASLLLICLWTKRLVRTWMAFFFFLFVVAKIRTTCASTWRTWVGSSTFVRFPFHVCAGSEHRLFETPISSRRPEFFSLWIVSSEFFT